MKQDKFSLADSFHEYFSVELATTSKQKEDAYRVRYRVYCDELAYEPAEQFPDGLERDEYDPQSLHILIRHRKSGQAAGCVRVVESVDTNPILPFEQNFPEALDPEFFNRIDVERSSMCEISRLAVDPSFRRRHGEGYSKLGDLHALDLSAHEKRTFSLIAEASFMAAAALTVVTERHHLFALMETYLCRLLGRSGIYFMRVGRNVEHHGLRAPYYVTTDSILKSMRPELLELYQEIHTPLERAYKRLKKPANAA